MKIIFPRIETFHFHKAYDGGSKYIYYLSQELVKQGCEVTIVTTPFEKGDYETKFYRGVKYVFLPPKYSGRKRLINIPWKNKFSKNLKKYLEKTDFDILHSAEAFALPYLKKKKRKPVIYQCWAMEAWYGKEPTSQKGFKKIYINQFLRKPWQYVLENSDSIAADGNFQVPRITKLGVPREKIFFLPNGVNFKEIQEIKKKYKNRREDLGIKKEDLLILGVSQIAPDKGIEDIINGFVMLKKDIPNAKLLMVGRGILESQMFDLVKRNGLVNEKDFFHRKNIPEEILYDYYFSSDIFVAATLSEDFMITIQEAMACGLPIVSSAQPYLVENGLNGYVVGFKNPKGIKDAILKIYKDKNMEKMGKESIKIAEKYDYEKIAESAIKEYKKLLTS
jgi:phosphatidylinositol alpha-mannosyltransferase|tara:strand:+ start:18128 stop:19303 length:1176 start_codon:yes stop_codon:yes gene_type:complete